MPPIEIAPGAVVSATAILGKAFRPLLDGITLDSKGAVKIGENAYIGDYCLIGCDVWLSRGTIVDDFSKIEPGSRIGEKNLIVYGAQICGDAVCGDANVIGGFIGEATHIGNNCRIFGRIVHRQDNPEKPWDNEESMEAAPVIGDNCFIGFGATIIGPVTLASRSYIAAGAIVTRDVPSRTVVVGTNRHVPISEWKGALRNSEYFKSAQ